jgi:hypothetical protein
MTFAAAIGLSAVAAPPASAAVGFGQAYWNIASDGGVFTHGPAAFHGSEGARALNAPVVGGAAYPFFEGYWMVASDGGIFNHGSADFFGSEGGRKLNAPAVGMAASPSGNGYWIAASDGGVFTHGDAQFFGSQGGSKLNAPVVGIAASPTGKGYWLVASDGGVFTHGDAGFFGSEGGMKLNKPIVGIAATPSGKGYWLVASDGGVFTHGDAGFFGSEGSTKLNAPVVGIGATNSGLGYRLVARDGGVFTHGDAGFLGSEGGIKLTKPMVGILTRPAFGIKVDPFATPTGSTDSSSWAPSGGKLTVTDAVAESGGDVPAGARVLGVEGLTGAQLGTISYDVDSGGPCDGTNPRINVYLDTTGDGIGDPASTVSLGCSALGTNTFTLTGGNASATVTGMDVIQGAVGSTAVLDNIAVAGVTVSDFNTARRAE